MTTMTANHILNADDANGATINSWSDRNPATIVKRTAKTITVQRDNAAHMSPADHDAYAVGHGKVVVFTRNYDAGMEVFTLRKNGRWIARGDSLRGRSLTVGHRDYYRDPSF